MIRSSPVPPLNLIWRRDTIGRVVEASFIKNVLLSTLDRPVRQIVFGGDNERVFVDDMLIVVRHAAAGAADNIGYVAEARRRGCRNLGVLHMGDEKGDADLGFYADADYVLRNYYFPSALKAPKGSRTRGIRWIPNGYANAIGPQAPERHLPMRHRTIVGFFAGQTAADPTAARGEMIRVVQENRLPCVVVGTQGFAQGLSPVEYAGHLANTRFALVPAGNSAETIRLYDALEAGAVPISLKAPFLDTADAIESPPFVLLDAWADLVPFMADYQKRAAGDPDFMEDRRREVARWWVDFKRAAAERVAALVGSMS